MKPDRGTFTYFKSIDLRMMHVLGTRSRDGGSLKSLGKLVFEEGEQ